jgi:hypothetical protein
VSDLMRATATRMAGLRALGAGAGLAGDAHVRISDLHLRMEALEMDVK